MSCGKLKGRFLYDTAAGSTVSFRSCRAPDADGEGWSVGDWEEAVCLGREGGSAGACYTVRLCVCLSAGRSGILLLCVPCVQDVREAGVLNLFSS